MNVGTCKLLSSTAAKTEVGMPRIDDMWTPSQSKSTMQDVISMGGIVNFRSKLATSGKSERKLKERKKRNLN